MIPEKQAAIEAIEAKRDVITDVADHIWEYAELSLQEEKSAALYCEVLEREGFQVEKGICGIETAFSASYGSGRPLIGILAEYDALSGLSQKAGSLIREELRTGRLRPWLRSQSAGGRCHGCSDRHEARIWSKSRNAGYGDILWLSGRRGRSGQGVYGKGWCVAKSGCSADLASGGCK